MEDGKSTIDRKVAGRKNLKEAHGNKDIRGKFILDLPHPQSHPLPASFLAA